MRRRQVLALPCVAHLAHDFEGPHPKGRVYPGQGVMVLKQQEEEEEEQKLRQV